MSDQRPEAPGPSARKPLSEAAGPVPQPSEGHSNLYLRVISALVLAPLLLAAVWLGGWPFFLVVSLAGLLILNEWIRITASADSIALIGAFGVGATAAIAWLGFDIGATLMCLSVAGLCLAVALLLRRPPWVAFGVVYAGLPVGAVLALRNGEAGLWAVAVLLALTWATDIGGYLFGKTIGGPKLWPAVSPKKTWAGAIGGLVAGGLAGLAVAAVSGIGSPVAIGLASAILSVAAQGGDLAESALKRRFGVKDSGALIPGHGGIMDRVDGLVASAVGAYLLGLLASGGGDPSLGLASM